MVQIRESRLSSSFVRSVFKTFNEKNKVSNDVEPVIPEGFFDVPKTFILFQIPFCESNEKASKPFLSKFHELTNNRYQVRIKWITKKVKTMFILKDKNPYPSCKVYEGICVCGENYVGETVRNVVTRWKEHEDIRQNSEVAKHLIHYTILIGK